MEMLDIKALLNMSLVSIFQFFSSLPSIIS
jgi:hypothetical protein